MIKKIFASIICFLIFQVSFAQQNDFQKEWAFGANAGLNFSKVSFYTSIPQEQLLQSTGGLTVRYISETHFGIQAELNYSLRGWKEKTDTVTRFNKYSRSISYLELPIMTHLYFNMGKRARLIINAGTQFGYYIGEKTLEKEIDPRLDGLPSYGYYDTKIQRPLDYGLVGGTGFELRTGMGCFILDGRYYFGLSDIFNNNNRADRFQSSSNQVMGVKLTYLFNISKSN